MIQKRLTIFRVPQNQQGKGFPQPAEQLCRVSETYRKRAAEMKERLRKIATNFGSERIALNQLLQEATSYYWLHKSAMEKVKALSQEDEANKICYMQFMFDFQNDFNRIKGILNKLLRGYVTSEASDGPFCVKILALFDGFNLKTKLTDCSLAERVCFLKELAELGNDGVDYIRHIFAFETFSFQAIANNPKDRTEEFEKKCSEYGMMFFTIKDMLGRLGREDLAEQLRRTAVFHLSCALQKVNQGLKDFSYIFLWPTFRRIKKTLLKAGAMDIDNLRPDFTPLLMSGSVDENEKGEKTIKWRYIVSLN